jgi:hypothetical protein
MCKFADLGLGANDVRIRDPLLKKVLGHVREIPMRVIARYHTTQI